MRPGLARRCARLNWMTELFRCPLIVVALVLLAVAGRAAAEGELQFAELGDCRLESGGVIMDCRLGYRTLGQYAADRSNVMLVPTWYTGTSGQLIDFGYVGPGRIADTNRFHVILVDAFGNGVSSSPSNSSGQALERFPRFNIRDMVDVQYRLLKEVLGIERVHVTLGVSMGGMQAFEWMVRYPEFMDFAVSIEGSPWPTSYDRLLWTAYIDAAETWDGTPEALARSSALLAKLDALTLWTPQHFVPMVDAEGFGGFMASFDRQLSVGGLFDRKYQTWAVLDHNVAQPFEGDAKSAAGQVRARVLNVVFRHDHMVNPEPAQKFTAMIGGESAVMDTPCGHMGVTRDCAQDEVAAVVNAFLPNPD